MTAGKNSVRPDARVLVVGTTTDYIHWIRLNCSGRTLFLTDPRLRAVAREPAPLPEEELLWDLSDHEGARRTVEKHLALHHLRLAGIACFDCESMELAAVLADCFHLPYSGQKAIGHCRNKYLTKKLWQNNRLETPAAILVRSAQEVLRFQRALNAPVVLKPVSGSGSELIFVCDNEETCRTGFHQVQEGLRRRLSHRLYADLDQDGPRILAQALIDGDEYSCDFIVREGRAKVIRLTRKIKSAGAPFGTARGYLLSASLPPGLDADRLQRTLYRCAAALGIVHAVCMLDFIMAGDRMVLLELAPRPGGDCLPHLLRRAWNLDILKLLVDFAGNEPLPTILCDRTVPVVGLRIHARQAGILRHIDAAALKKDPRVREILLTREPGHRIHLPPDDYESWLLGHVIFQPDGPAGIEHQCNELLERIGVVMEEEGGSY